MIACQQKVEQHWFDEKCRELVGKPATRNAAIKAINWFNLVPSWVSDEDLQKAVRPWAPSLPLISWTSASVMRSEELAAVTRGDTPMPDSPASADLESPWAIGEEDYGKRPFVMSVYQPS